MCQDKKLLGPLGCEGQGHFSKQIGHKYVTNKQDEVQHVSGQEAAWPIGL